MDEILNLIELVSEDLPSYSFIYLDLKVIRVDEMKFTGRKHFSFQNFSFQNYKDKKY